jgi:hypothetical protein
MDSVASLLFAMRSKRVIIWTDNGQLLYQAPRGALGESEIAVLRSRRSEIADFLRRSISSVLRPPALERRRAFEPVPLTPAQRAILNRGVSRRESVLTSRLRGALQIGPLEQAVIELVRRHEVLRTRIAMRDGIAVQEAAAPPEFRLETVDLTDGASSERGHRAKAAIGRLLATPIDVATDPLFIARLFVLGDRDHVLLIAMDAVTFDPGSIPILQRDLCALYAEAAHQAPPALPPVCLQFYDFAIWQQQALRLREDANAAYWNARLAGARRLRVFAEQGLERASPGTAVSRFTFDQQLTTAVRELTVQRGTTLLMTLLTAYLVALSRWCDTNDLVVQVPTIARRHPEVQHAVGPFGTVLFLRVQLRQQESFIDLLARVVDEFNAAYEHDDAGAIPAATPSPPYASNPRFNFISQSLITSIQPTFDWSHVRGGDDSPITFERFDVKVPAGAQQEEPFLRMIDRRDELVGLLAYRTDRAKPETAKRFERSFRVVAEGMTQQPGGRISRWGQRA